MVAGWLSICASLACDGNSTIALPSSPSEVPHPMPAAAQHNPQPIGNVHSATRLAPMARTIRRRARPVLELSLTRADGNRASNAAASVLGFGWVFCDGGH